MSTITKSVRQTVLERDGWAAESWRPVVGYEAFYEVSDLGRVRSLERTINDVWGRVRRWRGRPLTASTGSAGYQTVKLSTPSGQRTHRVHVLVMAAFVGPRPPGHEVAHFDGNPANNVLSNLRYATPASNQSDRLRHGRSNRGVRHPQARLNAAAVREIRRMLAAGVAQKDIASHFGVARTTVSSIACGNTWGWLQ